MKGRVTKARTRRSRATQSKAVQATLLDAVATAATELPQSHREQSLAKGGPAQDATPAPTAKRPLDATPESDPSPAKKARLTQIETTLQQPEPRPPKRPHALFLEDVDPVGPHPRAASPYTFVSEWLESIGSDREKRCRSDSHLYRIDDPISRQLTRSAPEMGKTRDADGFVVPPTPTSTSSRSYRADADAASVAPSDITSATSSRRSGKSLVEEPLYRDMNLAANNIYMRSAREPFPDDVASLVNHMRQDRCSPGPSPDEVWQDKALEELGMGATEAEVEKYFSTRIFPDCGPGDTLKRSDRQPMAKHAVASAGSRLKVSTPVPDMLYGYNRHAAFPQQQGQLISMGTGMVATNQVQSLLYPFFVIEFKGDGGSMWVATNQCLGGAASCVTIAERLNDQLRHCSSDKIQPIDSAAFSIAMNGTEARLYVSWKHNELDYYMANVKSFLLQEPGHYIEFRKYVRNIIDWGKDKRLDEIRASLDSLLEEGRKKTSKAMKSRQPPSEGSAISGKKHKSSSRRNSKSDKSKGQRRGSRQEVDEASSQGSYGSQLSYQPNLVGVDEYGDEDAGQGSSSYYAAIDPDEHPAPEPACSSLYEDTSSHRDVSVGSQHAGVDPAYVEFAGYDEEQTQEAPVFDSAANQQGSFATSFTSSFTFGTGCSGDEEDTQ